MNPFDNGYETNRDRITRALVVGVIVGPVLTGAYLAAAILISSTGSEWTYSFAPAGSVAFLAIIFGFIPWALGLTLVGGGTWFALHRLGSRSPAVAAVTGAVLINIPIGLTALLAGWPARVAVVMAPVGVVTGLIVWRIAYRRPAPVDEVFS